MAHILVIDDDSSVLENLVAFLEDEGIDVLSANNADKALALISEEKPQLAIVDMRLPGIDGNELICKAHELYPPLQYLIHTGSSDYVLPEELKNIGITENDIFKKPVSDMSVFVEAIHSKIGD